MENKIFTLDLVANYENSLKNDEKSSNTIEKYMRDLRRFLEFVGERNLDKTLVLEYKSKLEQEYALASANSMIAAINSFFKYAGWMSLCVKQFKVQRKTYCSEDRELTKQEYIALVRTAEKDDNERLSLLIQTICSTGIRVSELKYITVEAAMKGEAVVSCKGKVRNVFLVSDLCKKLVRYAKKKNIKSGIVFVTKNGKPLNRSNIWRDMKELCNRAGVLSNKVFPHNLRHLFARTFYCLEKDIAKLADILGHISINTTRVYIISSGAEHRRKMERMHLII